MMIKILWIFLMCNVIRCDNLSVNDGTEKEFEYLDPTPFEIPSSNDTGQNTGRGSRIVYGSAAASGQFPHYTLMYISRAVGVYQCGGGLVSSNYVLTAKHCVEDARSIELRFGLTYKDSFDQRIYASAVARNPIVDIAVVKLISSVRTTTVVKPALLPRYIERYEQFANKMAKVSGFGRDQTGKASSYMMFTELKIMTNGACLPYFGIVDSKTLCAKSTISLASTCPGDSGSSLLVKDMNNNLDVIVGVVSYGHGAGCNQGYPVVYARTAQQLDWIYDYTNVARRS